MKGQGNRTRARGGSRDGYRPSVDRREPDSTVPIEGHATGWPIVLTCKSCHRPACRASREAMNSHRSCEGRAGRPSAISRWRPTSTPIAQPARRRPQARRVNQRAGATSCPGSTTNTPSWRAREARPRHPDPGVEPASRTRSPDRRSSPADDALDVETKASTAIGGNKAFSRRHASPARIGARRVLRREGGLGGPRSGPRPFATRHHRSTAWNSSESFIDRPWATRSMLTRLTLRVSRSISDR